MTLPTHEELLAANEELCALNRIAAGGEERGAGADQQALRGKGAEHA